MEPVVITVAITGSLPKKADTPAIPVDPIEQVESTHQAFEAGAAVAHIHVRNEREEPVPDVERFTQVQAGIRRHCPGMIIQFSTGSRGRAHDERGKPLALRPDMASLTTGSVNFATQTYENPPAVIDALAADMLTYGVKPEIEVFDLCMIYNAADMVARGLLERPLHVQFVMGIKNALPAQERTLDLLLAELHHVLPDATWGALGIGRHQLTVNGWCLERGGHLRTGLEDNIYRSKGVLATSNAELVSMAVELASRHNRRPATPDEARRLLNVRPAAAAPAHG